MPVLLKIMCTIGISWKISLPIFETPAILLVKRKISLKETNYLEIDSVKNSIIISKKKESEVFFFVS